MVFAHFREERSKSLLMMKGKTYCNVEHLIFLLMKEIENCCLLLGQLLFLF